MKTISKNKIKLADLAAIGSYATSLWTTRKVVLISDKKAFDRHGTEILQYLTILGFDVQTLILNETCYTTATASLIYQFLTNQKMTTEDGIISLGDEALCQLGGYVSATYLGGLSLIQIPTTLIAQLAVCTQLPACLINPETTQLQAVTPHPAGILIDPKLTKNLTKAELAAAQTLLLDLGIAQDHICRRELRKKAQINDHKLNYKKLFNALMTDSLTSADKVTNRLSRSQLQAISNRLLVSKISLNHKKG
ncbi:dehydroquinate synthase/iron-containing alcohol dehydrogenase family protein [Enterococcus pingfangensis]|uniref:3-dehydroquinate synthase n=1 Tax=Enterococcus pingfangensis TaxID=2559924 RepID=UPI0010F8D794|nr:3-dehydroquinate synthase [Enterococcus pingfangensis]